MAKIYGLFGSMTGKLADTVMSVRNGEQIARKYQPIVYNPSTAAQVAQRAKMKLLSQLSAIVAPVIAIPRVGAVSSRNLFTKKNFPLTSYATNTATIDMVNVQLTNSQVALPSLLANAGGTAITAWLAEENVDVDRVVYCLFEQIGDSVRLVTSQVISDKGSTTQYWAASFSPIAGQAIILAYGVRDNTEAARAAFGDLTVATAQTVANLIVTRTLLESDVTLTKTYGISVAPSRGGDDEPEKKSKK